LLESNAAVGYNTEMVGEQTLRRCLGGVHKLLILYCILGGTFAAVAKEETCNVLLVRALSPSRFLKEVHQKVTPFNAEYDEFQAWQNLKEPIRFGRPLGLSYLRSKIQESGITTVVPGNPLNAKEIASLQYLYGTQVAFAGRKLKSDFDPIQLRGVVLHPGNAALLSEFYRGEINPQLGVGKIYRSLDKWKEYRFTENVQPGAMPKTYRMIDLSNTRFEENLFEMDEGTLRNKLDQALSRLFQAAESVFPVEKFPLGSLIKISDEVQTGDDKKLLRSTQIQKSKLINEAMQEFNRFRKLYNSTYFETTSESYLAMKDQGSRALHLMAALFLAPQKIMIQEAVPIAKTDLGYPQELRFVFMESEVLVGFPRHTIEYLPEALEQGMQWARNILIKVNPNLPLVGAMDLVRLENGEFRLIEWNFGTEGMELDAAYLPVRGNQVTSELIGETTPFLRDLEKMFAEPVDVQKHFMEQVSASLVKYGKDEIAVWLKDRYLKEWLRNPTLSAYETTMQNLRFLFEKGYKKGKLGLELITSSDLFMKKHLQPLN
jgi:hypothetical protein